MVNGNISDYHGTIDSKTVISGEGDTTPVKIMHANNETEGNLTNINFNGNYRFR
jgi:hypothetical protein